MVFFQEKRKKKLAEVIKENQNTLYRMAYSYVRNEENAKDIVQETILTAFSKLPTLKEDRYMKTWLIRICINQSLDTLRRTKKNTERTVELQDYLAAPQKEPSYQYSDLFQAILRLDEKIRTVIVLRYFEEMKFDEISAAVGTNVNTVKAQVYKGLQLLKEYMREEEDR